MDQRTSSGLHAALLAQSAWMRRLAASLVRDPESADELVQDAWVATLRSPPRDDQRLRPFLGRVLHRLAARRWALRDRDRVGAREDERSSGGPSSADATGEELAEKLESERVLLEELQALAEPYRSTLIRHYHSGLELAEIARRDGLPAGTVRWRLHEGLARLRERLDRRHGSRGAWCLAFAALHRWPEDALTALHATAAVSSGAAITTGVLFMHTATKLVAGVAAAAAVAVGVFFFTQAPETVRERVPAAPTSHAADEKLSAPSTSALAAPSEPARAERASSAAAPVAAQPQAPVEELAASSVELRVVDERRQPIAGARCARIALSSRAAAGGDIGRWREESNTTTSADGRARLELPDVRSDFQASFVVAKDGFATRFLDVLVRPQRANFAEDVVLAPGSAVSGRVLDTARKPVEGARVCVLAAENEVFGATSIERMRAEGPRGVAHLLETQSAVDGTFRIDGAPAGVLRAWAKAADTRWSLTEPLDLAPRTEKDDVELVLEPFTPDDPSAPIEGIVVGPDRAPLAGIQIRIEEDQVSTGNRWSSSRENGADGRFTIVPRNADARIRLTFSDPRKNWAEEQLEDVRRGSKELVVQLFPPRTLDVIARDDDGPVTSYRVRWLDARGEDRGFADVEESHEDGRARVRAPRGTFTLVVDSPVHRSERVGPFDERSLPREREVKLKRLPGIHGRVVADGEPVANARVRLQSAPDDAQISIDGFDSFIVPDDVGDVRTDAQGRFVLPLKRSARYALFVDADGYARRQHGPLELDAAVGAQDLELALDVGGTLEGRVLTAPGRSPAGIIVAVNRGDAAPRTQVVGPDGTFRFPHLAAGPWELRKVKREFTGPSSYGVNHGDGAKPKQITPSFTIAVGETTRRDLDLRDDEPSLLDVVLTVNGEPAKAWSLTLWPADTNVVTEELPAGTTDGNGRVRIESERIGDVNVWIQPPPELGSSLHDSQPLTLRRGVQPWSFDLRAGSLEGRVASLAGTTTRLRVRRADTADPDTSTMFQVDASGNFRLPLVPAGELVLERLDNDAPDGQRWVELKRLTIEARKTARVDVN